MNDEHQQLPPALAPTKLKLPLLNRVIKAFSILVAVIVGFAIAAALFNVFLNHKMKRPITGQVPEAFPVVVFWQSPPNDAFHAKVIEFESIPEFRKDHPNLSFLLPSNRQEDMVRELKLQADGRALQIRDIPAPHLVRRLRAEFGFHVVRMGVERRSEIRVVRHGSGQCRLGPS